VDVDLTNEHWAFLSTKPAGRRESRSAMAALVVSVLVFLAAAPFAKTPLAEFPAFIPVYVSALVICDLITAALLFGQFSVLRSHALLVLAAGYLFCALITSAYAIIFPGLFAPPGLFGAGPQTTSAMYMFWHTGFPLAVMAYTRFKDQVQPVALEDTAPRGKARKAIVSTIAGVLALVVALTVFATQGHDTIPTFLHGNRTTETGHAFLFGIWCLSVLALVLLWRRRPHSVLDMWLQVVLCVWLFDIALAALLNTGRYDLGWYVGRIYGLLAASFLLMVLLIEDGKHYARLVQMSVALNTANMALSRLSRHDGLTELANRRFFDEYLAEQIAVAARQQRPLALVLCDVDQFKPFNDHYGHPAGDACLRLVADTLQFCCQRPADKAARYGGEEFALILPDTDRAGAIRIAEAARQAVARLNVLHAYSHVAPHVSISCGVSVLPAGVEMDAAQLIAAADRNLYQAKHQGRNRVVSTQDA
jgi:diguanylate cyclase (GGDEF)-like protein